MPVSTKSFILVSLLYVLVHCNIPNLNVRSMDKSFIAKKRQDTLDMCRIFTEENAKIQHTKPKIVQSYKNIHTSHNRRHKREVNMTYAINPALKADAQRVESIVDKLYDEMEERGQKVTYRKNTILTSTTTKKKPTNVSTKAPKRRFFFAPKVILGPVRQALPPKTEDTIIYDKARWKHGIIPYFIDSKTYDAHLQDIITGAFDYIEKATCIRLQKLRERPTDKSSMQNVDWVYITNPSGVRQCVHSNEKRKIDGVQMSVLGYDCMAIGDIVHEVMHILGFSHEHTRSDRDQYISIIWDNIKPGYKKYFEVAKAAEQYTLENLPYDYASVLHYPSRAFSKNGQQTILTAAGVKIGQREGLSEIDLEKVGTIYSSECVERNREYLLKTCPSVVKSEEEPVNITQQDIDDYFKDRLWPFGLISYKLRDQMEFSTEEKENIKAVIRHIEKETCIQFRDITEHEQNDVNSDENPHADHMDINNDSDIAKSEEINKRNSSSIIKTDPIYLASKDPDFFLSENDINNLDDQDEHAEPKVEFMPQRIRKQFEPKVDRRHANNILVLTRSAKPGCKCPKPGAPKGNLVLEINEDCFNSVNDLLHLFVHVLGLDHQHNMYDRDSYLHIVWDNLTPEVRKELEKKLPPAASVGFPYDYQSVMHYPWLQIKDGVTNMMYPIWNDGWAMGHWQGLSSFDVQKLNLLYFNQCSERDKQSQTF